MELKIDQHADALYLRLDEGFIVESEEVQPGIILDFDKDNRVVGVEVLNIRKRMAQEKLKTFQFESNL